MKQLKDASGQAYYQTEDEKYLIMKDAQESYWNVWKRSNNGTSYHAGMIYDGYTLIWDGMKRLKDAKGYVQELREEDAREA